eukprot:6720138-Pyramimonas_sp.AAC.2
MLVGPAGGVRAGNHGHAGRRAERATCAEHLRGGGGARGLAPGVERGTRAGAKCGAACLHVGGAPPAVPAALRHRDRAPPPVRGKKNKTKINK